MNKTYIYYGKSPEEKLQLYHEQKSSKGLDRQFSFLKTKRLLHPILLWGIKLLRLINRHSLSIMGSCDLPSNRPCIIVFTHQNKWDIERVAEAVKINFYILAGDPEHTLGVFPDALLFDLNGVIYVDNSSKTDRSVALSLALEALKEKRVNLLWSPEGVWNISPNVLVYPLHNGPAICAALTDAVILPIGLHRDGNKFWANIGNCIYPENHTQKSLKQTVAKINQEIRDSLASLVWDILEQAPVEHRNVFPKNYWSEYINATLNEWTDKQKQPIYTPQIINTRIATK